MKQVSPYKNFEFFFKQLSFEHLNYQVIKKIINFKLYGNEDGFLLLKNNYLGHIAPTPSSRDTMDIKDFTSETLISSIAALLGDPSAFAQESDGQVINNFFPHKDQAKSTTSDSYDTELELHTENAFHQFSPDYLILLCLRQDVFKEAITWISPISKIMTHLTPKQIDYFHTTKFNFLSDYSHEGKNKRLRIGKWQTIFYNSKENPHLVFDPYFMEADSKRDLENLKLFSKIAWEVAHPIRLEAGDLLIIDNKHAAHARSKFRVINDGSDRWLQRIFVIKNLLLKTKTRLITEIG
jgi:hypothetical protein